MVGLVIPPMRATRLPAINPLLSVVVSFSLPGPGCSPGAPPGQSGIGVEGAAIRAIAAQRRLANVSVIERMDSILCHERPRRARSIAAVDVRHDIGVGRSLDGKLTFGFQHAI